MGDGKLDPWRHCFRLVLGTPTKPVSMQPRKEPVLGDGGLTGSSYNNGENSWLQSPCFDFSALVKSQYKSCT